MVKNRPAHAGDLRDAGSVPGWERCPGGGHGNPLQYPSLENPMDRGDWWATESDTNHVTSHSTGAAMQTLTVQWLRSEGVYSLS